MVLDSVVHVAGIVPQPDHRPGQVIFVSEDTDAGRGQHEKAPGRRFDPKPASREYSEKMRTGEYQNIAFDRTHTAHNVIGPRAHLVRRFAAGAAVAE